MIKCPSPKMLFVTCCCGVFAFVVRRHLCQTRRRGVHGCPKARARPPKYSNTKEAAHLHRQRDRGARAATQLLNSGCQNSTAASSRPESTSMQRVFWSNLVKIGRPNIVCGSTLTKTDGRTTFSKPPAKTVSRNLPLCRTGGPLASNRRTSADQRRVANFGQCQ
jgi:hypothetical protein